MGKFLKGLVEIAKEASGTYLADCKGKNAPGIRCKKKVKPGYGDSCGDPRCTQVFGTAL